MKAIFYASAVLAGLILVIVLSYLFCVLISYLIIYFLNVGGIETEFSSWAGGAILYIILLIIKQGK